MQAKRRSMLYVPGSDPKKCLKALMFNSDSVIFDLEDAVAPNQKEFARQTVCELLKAPRETGKELVVRVNQVSDSVGMEDLKAILPCKPDTVILPKASAREVTIADTFVTIFREDREIGLIPLIETMHGLVTLREILNSSDKITGVQFGAEDLTKEMGIRRTAQGKELSYARSELTFIARSFGVDAIDTPYVDYRDVEGFEQDLAYIRSIGMTAKTAIHPSQIEKINQAFTFSERDIAEAKEIVEAFEKAVQQGLGVISINGKMVDAPVAKRAADVLASAGLNEVKGF